VQVHEQQSVVASGASGNPSAIFYPGVTIGWQPLSQLYFMGFSHTLMLLRQLAEQQAIAHDLCGMLLFPKPHEDPLRQAKVLATMQPHSSIFYGVDAAQASEHAGIALKQSGLFFPASGWVNLKDFTAALLANPHIEVITSHAITAMQFDCVAPTVLCNGWHAQQLYAPLQGAMHPVAGQVSGLPAAQATDGLRCVLSYGGYITPPIGSVHHVGATYDKRCDARYDAEADVQNIAKLSQFLQVGMPISATKEGWFAVRSVTRNRLPLVGKLQDGLYASLAHASRGLLSCGLAGEYVASQLYGDPLPLPRSIACLLRPDRFVA
jgi:tRNA 5-methylaminomethyl-2-thiouridine biosynthesis bifunctional protein